MVYPISKIWLYPFCRIISKKTKGIENIPNKTPFIIVSNHKRLLDPFLITYIILKRLNRKVHFLTRSAWYVPDLIYRQWAGCIPLIDPKQAFSEMKEHINNGEITAIFPEGIRAKKPIENPKTGAVRLALETGTPILPIGIKFSFIPFTSAIVIGKLIYLNKNKDINRQASNLMQCIYKLRDSA